MEKTCFCSKTKHQSIATSSRTGEVNGHKFKNPWNFCNECLEDHRTQDSGAEPDLVSWTPRLYSCSFCKKVFSSAQALGGHMNVHRRDRARMRQSPPRVYSNGTHNGCSFCFKNPNLEPNPGFNSKPSCGIGFLSSSTSYLSPHFPTHLVAPTVPAAIPVRDLRPITDMFGVEKFEPFVREKGWVVVKNAEFVRLDLQIGLMSSHSKEDLDLELRLGYA